VPAIRVMSTHRLLCSLLALALGACSAQPATSPTDGAPSSTMGLEAAPNPAPSPSAPAPSAAPTASAEPSASASASATPAPVAEPPLPSVKVVNIGMHIGGGPNDDITKEPIRRSVHPHFDEFRRCFAKVEDPKKGGDFGVDLRIERAGGKAKVSHPRTALKGKEFKACVVSVFEGIEFLKPKGGTTTVSYSLRFTPKG
jgi:pyruvate/2-oxoglutarate dehydrogenase complex dihydrolipoamide acyltransferase (E2) component